MKELLVISGLAGGYREGVDVLHGIDLTIGEGQALGIIGLNGSGKSTLGKAIMNMIPFRRGQLVWKGTPVETCSTCGLVRLGLGIMQQGGRVFPTLSVWDNLALAFEAGTWEAYGQIRSIFPFLQQSKRALQHQMADRLSGGQKHQLALAMTLATRPELVILDEPSAGLSPKSVAEMYGLLQAMREQMKMTLVLIEQNVSKAVDFCDEIVMLQQGTVRTGLQGHSLEEIESIMFNDR